MLYLINCMLEEIYQKYLSFLPIEFVHTFPIPILGLSFAFSFFPSQPFLPRHFLFPFPLNSLLHYYFLSHFLVNISYPSLSVPMWDTDLTTPITTSFTIFVLNIFLLVIVIPDSIW